MSLTITLGWWLIPAVITAISLGTAAIYVAKREPGGDYNFGVNILLVGAAALIVSLVAWVTYFGLRLFFS